MISKNSLSDLLLKRYTKDPLDDYLIRTNTVGDRPRSRRIRKLPKKPTFAALKKRKLSDRDETWLGKIFLKKDLDKVPSQILLKLFAHEMIEIKLTEKGQKTGIIEAILQVGKK